MSWIVWPTKRSVFPVDPVGSTEYPRRSFGGSQPLRPCDACLMIIGQASMLLNQFSMSVLPNRGAMADQFSMIVLSNRVAMTAALWWC
mmetsp:Transcript_70885/g.229942  ORF Transcript_70885/g.229942 Transcript_70885/m.229942 type:complete len:88 (+) Transcript_70885:2504-2767(+)